MIWGCSFACMNVNLDIMKLLLTCVNGWCQAASASLYVSMWVRRIQGWCVSGCVSCIRAWTKKNKLKRCIFLIRSGGVQTRKGVGAKKNWMSVIVTEDVNKCIRHRRSEEFWSARIRKKWVSVFVTEEENWRACDRKIKELCSSKKMWVWNFVPKKKLKCALLMSDK